MNIDELCEYLQSIKGEGTPSEKIPENATILGLKVCVGYVEFFYETPDGTVFTDTHIPCEQANSFFFGNRRVEEENKNKPQPKEKNVKKLFKKRKVK